MGSFWRRITACIRRQSEQEEESEMVEVSKPERRFPILKLPHVVLNEFMKQLQPVDVIKLSFTSKRTNEICQLFAWKHPRSWLEYSYPPKLRLCYDGIHTATYTFKETCEKKEDEVYMDQEISKHAYWAVDNRRSDQEGYIVYSASPTVMIYTWAGHLRHLFEFQHFPLNVIPGNHAEQMKNYLKWYIRIHGRSTSRLSVNVDLDAPGNAKERVALGGMTMSCFKVESTLTYTLNRPFIYRAFQSTHANLQAALSLKHSYVDLKNATITDEQLNWMVKRWEVDVEDEDVEFLTLSVRRSYPRKQIDWDVLLRGVVYERLEESVARQYGRLHENRISTEQHPCTGGIDIFRADGEILSIHVECDNVRVVDPDDEDELVSVPNPDSHVIHFVAWWPEEDENEGEEEEEEGEDEEEEEQE